MKWILFCFVMCFIGCVVTDRQETIRLEAEVKSPDGFSENPQYAVSGKVVMEFKR